MMLRLVASLPFFYHSIDVSNSTPPTPLHVRVCLLFNSITFHPPGAFWEDEEEEEEEEFLARKGGKGSKKQTKACQNAYMGVQNCVEDILARNTNATRNWEKKIFRANRSARVCANNAIYDEDKLDCYSNVIDRIARRCPVPVDDFKEACKIPLEFEAEDEELESTAYATYLRA